MPDKSLILFDGICNLCNGSVNFIIDHDDKDYFRFSALQSVAAKNELSKFSGQTDLSSVVLLEDGKVFTRSTAALKIVRRLRGGWPLLYVFMLVPRPVRDLVYDCIARNRYRWFGKKDSCRVPTPELRRKFLA